MSSRQNRRSRRTGFVVRGFLGSVLLGLSSLAIADSVAELHALVDARDAQGAWAMAQRLEADNAGDPEFDFWYAMAANAAGKRNQAVFALERVVVNQPDNPRAKLELADTYYQYGNMTEARRLFNEVLATNPPPDVQQNIRTFLGAITAREAQKGTQVSWSLGLAAGYDSNVGSATDVVHHDYVFPTFQLNSQSLASDAGFIEARAGIDVSHPVSQRTMRFLSASIQRRDNDSVNSPGALELLTGGNFDNTQLSVTAGWNMRRGVANWRIPFGVQALWAESESIGIVNDDRFLFTTGVEYSKPLSSSSGMMAFARLGESHYPSEPNRNSQMELIGAGYNWSAKNHPVSMNLALTLGSEPAKLGNVTAKANSRDYGGFRFGARWTLTPTQSLYGSAGWTSTKFREVPPISTWGKRSDTLLDVSLGWQKQVSRAMTVNVDASWASNDSRKNSLFDFERTQIKFGTNWRF